MNTFYTLNVQDSKKASLVLSRAFFDYPTFTCIFPDIKERQKKLHKVLQFLLKLGIYNGVVVSTSNNLEAIAIWYFTEAPKTSILTIFRSGLLGLLFSLKPSSFRKFMSIGKSKEANRKNLLSGNYVFLDMVGVHPGHQKKGFGKILIHEMLDKYNRYKLPVYLETSNVKNIEYYAKYGFTLVDVYEIDQLKSYCMIRENQ
jgi:hypothetical protein